MIYLLVANITSPKHFSLVHKTLAIGEYSVLNPSRKPPNDGWTVLTTKEISLNMKSTTLQKFQPLNVFHFL